jgi:glycine hydroxymethyltransferase
MNSIFDLTHKEFNKQRDTLNLIASENYPSPKTLDLLGSVWSNKYAEGYPGKRYYAGNVFSDELELLVQEKALQVFDLTRDENQQSGEYGVNVQVLSGSPANSIVFLSVLNYGDTILSCNLANGGHLSHLHATSNWNKFFKLINYDVKDFGENTFEVDIEDFTTKIQQYKPKLVIIGFSAYSRKYEFTQMCKIAHENGCLVLADIAHINGLVAAKLHSSPFGKGVEGADFVSMTTHKTLRGPRSAMLFAKNYLPDYYTIVGKETSLIGLVNKTVFPGTSGGPHLNKIAAVGQSLFEILGEDEYPDKVDFVSYSQNVLDTCKSLENSLQQSGLEIISPTQNHLCLVKFPESLDSLEIQRKLERVGVITNRNTIPFDQKTAFRPSGMRFGTAALTSRGLSNVQAEMIGTLIADTVFDRYNESELQHRVKEIVATFNWWY